jgi:hypothetical protein
MGKKQKVSVCLQPETLATLTALQGDHSRSFIVNRAIQLGLQQLRQDPGLILRGP